MQIDAVQWFLSRRKYFAVGVTVGIFLLVFILKVTDANHEAEKTQIRLRRQALDDDELHDQELLAAVVQSLKEWSQNSKSKSLVLGNSHHRVKRDEEIVCYGELGCFRDEGPFDYLDMLPSPPEEIGTKFLFFTRKNLQNAQVFSYFNFTSMYGNTHFNSSNPTKVIIHGFGSNCQKMWAYEMQLAILREVEANIICVDWENGAALPNYVRAAVNTRLVGKQVALLIFWLNENLGARTEEFHLIGFSLGAHVAGFTGQELQNLSRITGLDPAGPLFESYDTKVRLDSSDALFVDVIHSNGDSLLMGGLGSWEPMGHVDFYPNGGRVQKGCSNLFLGAVRDFLWSASDGDGRSLCNHRRAYKFFTESLSNRCRFPAFACENYDKFLTGACFNWDNSRCGDMGYYADRLPNPKKGLLYLVTRDDEPFCANQYRITVESSPSVGLITTYGGLEAILIGHDFINETFLVTQTLKDNMIAGKVIQRLIVAHPAITEPIQIQLKYTAYQGWLYSGISGWSMDSLILTNAYGKSMSFCTRLLLPSGIPVTIRLTAGVCLNRYRPLGVPGRPIFPPHPYDTFPTQGTDVSTTPVAGENMTSPTATVSVSGVGPTSAYETIDLDLSMKPPAISVVQNSNSNSAEVGPPYKVDWSEWHPLQPSSQPFKPSPPYANDGSTGGSQIHNKPPQIGTPVEVYPPPGDDLPTEEVTKVESELESNTLNMNNTSLSPELSVDVSEPVTIRICHISNEKGDNGTTNTTWSQKLDCTYPETSTLGPDGKLNVTNATTMVIIDPLQNGSLFTNELGRMAPSGGNIEHEALQSNILLVHSNLSSTTDMSIPSEAFWTAMHNNSMIPGPNGAPQYQGADPDVVLPPHLSYILQQLESQGLGPKVSTLNPHSMNTPSSTSMASNTINHTHNPRHVGGLGYSQLSRVQMSPQGSNKHRGLVASSRALKHRPVALSTRRQSKLLDVGTLGYGQNEGQIELGGGRQHSEKHTSMYNMHPHSRPIYPRQMPPPPPIIVTPLGVGVKGQTLIGQSPTQSPTHNHVAVAMGSQSQPIYIAQESIQQKSYVRVPSPGNFGARIVSTAASSGSLKQQGSMNPIYYVTNPPKGYYLMPHFNYGTNERGRYKVRRIITSPSPESGAGIGAGNLPSVLPTNPSTNSEINLNNFQSSSSSNSNTNPNPNSGNFYDENRLRLQHSHSQSSNLMKSVVPGVSNTRTL